MSNSFLFFFLYVYTFLHVRFSIHFQDKRLLCAVCLGVDYSSSSTFTFFLFNNVNTGYFKWALCVYVKHSNLDGFGIARFHVYIM